jgi:hypothetical protein
MELKLMKALLFLAACFCLVGIGSGIYASRESISAKKGKSRLIAFLLCGVGICTAALALGSLQWATPIYQVDGIIESAQVHSRNRGYRTSLRVQTSSGGELELNADGRSPYFRTGEHLKVSYRGYSGSIHKAQFLSSTGSEEGVFNGTDDWPPYFMLLLGLLVMWAGVRKFKRDPEGAERV